MPSIFNRLFSSVFLSLLAIGSTSRAADSQPNILLIMADDLGWKDLRCYGNKQLDTPHIDRLAAQGLLFTDAYSASPVCTPTRAALMTGESPARLNITNHAGGHPPNYQKPGTDLITPIWLRHLPLERVTLAEQLKKRAMRPGSSENGISPIAHRQTPEQTRTCRLNRNYDLSTKDSISTLEAVVSAARRAISVRINSPI